MGTIKQGILGGFSGKVGTVVGGNWKGISYMRALAQNVKNPRTDAQMNQRSKFALAIAFLKPITNYVRVSFKPYAARQTAFNAAMSYIVANAISGEYPDLTLDFAKVLVSRGSLFPVENASAEVDAGKVSITWTDNSGISDALATDVAMPLVFNYLRGEAVFSTAAAVRTEGIAEINLPTEWNGDTVQIYLGFISQDGKAIANSIYLGEKTLI